MEEWWQEIKMYSYRDQLSFNYVMWKLGTKVYYFPKNFIIEYFSYRIHSSLISPLSLYYYSYSITTFL